MKMLLFKKHGIIYQVNVNQDEVIQDTLAKLRERKLKVYQFERNSWREITDKDFRLIPNDTKMEVEITFHGRFDHTKKWSDYVIEPQDVLFLKFVKKE